MDKLDRAEPEKIADELIAKAEKSLVPREQVVSSATMYLALKSLLHPGLRSWLD